MGAGKARSSDGHFLALYRLRRPVPALAGVSPRTFFSYFPGKEDMLFAELDERTNPCAHV